MYNEHCNRLHKDHVKFSHLSDLVREMAKNCRNEKYENLKIQCKDGDLRLNQVIAMLILPELIYIDTLASPDVILVPDLTIQEIHLRMQNLFQSMNKDLNSKMNEINSDPFYMLFRPQPTAKFLFSSPQTPSFSLPQSPLIPLSLATSLGPSLNTSLGPSLNTSLGPSLNTSLGPSLNTSLAPSPTNHENQHIGQLPSALQDNPAQISNTVEKIINEELVNEFPDSEIMFFNESQFSDSTNSAQGLRLTAAAMSGANELISSTSNHDNLSPTSNIYSKGGDSLYSTNLRSSEKNLKSYQRQSASAQRTMETRQYHSNPIESEFYEGLECHDPQEQLQGGQVEHVPGKQLQTQHHYPLEETAEVVTIADRENVDQDTVVYQEDIGSFESEYNVSSFDESKKGNTYINLVTVDQQRQVYVDVGYGLLEECRTTPSSLNQDVPKYSSSIPGNSSSVAAGDRLKAIAPIVGTAESIFLPMETQREEEIVEEKSGSSKNGSKSSVLPSLQIIKCDTCDKMVQRRNLKRHQLLHATTVKYACTICDKQFPRAVHLNNHIKVHNGEKSFKCDECGNCFLLNSELNKHKKIHATREFKCVECDKLFITNVKLQRHMWSHKEEKNYECDYCASNFNRIDNLKKHLKKTHGVQLPDLRDHKLTSQRITTVLILPEATTNHV